MTGAGSIAFLLLLATQGNEPAQELSRTTIDSGGGAAAGASFEVRGTIGQPEPETAAGTTFQVRSGFWVKQLPSGDCIFADGFETPLVLDPSCSVEAAQ